MVELAIIGLALLLRYWIGASSGHKTIAYYYPIVDGVAYSFHNRFSSRTITRFAGIGSAVFLILPVVLTVQTLRNFSTISLLIDFVVVVVLLVDNAISIRKNDTTASNTVIKLSDKIAVGLLRNHDNTVMIISLLTIFNIPTVLSIYLLRVVVRRWESIGINSDFIDITNRISNVFRFPSTWICLISFAVFAHGKHVFENARRQNIFFQDRIEGKIVSGGAAALNVLLQPLTFLRKEHSMKIIGQGKSVDPVDIKRMKRLTTRSTIVSVIIFILVNFIEHQL